MFSEFKNLELFRHQVSSRVEKSLRRYADQSKKSAESITNNIFSACCSLVIAFLAHNYINQNNPHKAILSFSLFIVAYIVAYYASHYITKIAESIAYNRKHHGQGLTELEAKELVDDFDHIACDNNLVGKLFAKTFLSEPDIDIKEYEFYELYYYVNVSSDITLRIVENAEFCINTLDKVNAVDLHRLYNQLDMLNTAKAFMLNHIADKELDAPNNLKLVIISQIFSLDEKLQKIKEKCDDFMNNNFSDTQVKALKDQYGYILENTGKKSKNLLTRVFQYQVKKRDMV